MTELNPEIWNNPTLGAAAPNKRLDVLEAQERENLSAEAEGRTPRTIVAENDYPGWEPQNWSSYSSPVHFSDEQPNDIPQPYDPNSAVSDGLNLEVGE